MTEMQGASRSTLAGRGTTNAPLPHAALGGARHLSRRAPARERSDHDPDSGGTAPEGVGGATGGNVLPAGS